MDLGLADKVALVTASSKGLGRAAAFALAAEGASVVISSRRADVLEATADELRSSGAEVLAVPGDVTDEAVPAALVAATIERFGRLDVLVANAGGPPAGRALDVDDEQLFAAFEANMVTSVRLIRAALPHLRQRAWGRICCIASHSVVQPMPNLALSNVARLGLYAYVKTAAFDLAGSGITINLACPGTHATDRMLELGDHGETMGDPADFGAIVALLCSTKTGYLNGTTIVVNGGTTLAL